MSRLVHSDMVAADRLVKRYGPQYGVLPSACEWAFAEFVELMLPRSARAVVCGHGRHIANVVVGPWARRTGIARSLVAQACEHIRKLGHSYAETYAEAHNNASIGMLLKAGFTVTGVTIEQGTHFVVMSKDLPPRRRARRASQRR